MTEAELSDERLAELLAGCDETPSGTWQVVEATQHHGPYVVTEWGPTVADLYTMSNPNLASMRNGGISFPVLFDNAAAHAAHIARCDPSTIRALLIELQRHRAAQAVRKAQTDADAFGGTSGHVTGAELSYATRRGYFDTIERLVTLIRKDTLSNDEKAEVDKIAEAHSWDGLSCYCGGGWLVGHRSGCPEAVRTPDIARLLSELTNELLPKEVLSWDRRAVPPPPQGEPVTEQVRFAFNECLDEIANANQRAYNERDGVGVLNVDENNIDAERCRVLANDAIAALSAQPTAGWRTMDSAPKDGTKFWGKVDDDAIAMFWHPGFEAFISSFNRMTLRPGLTYEDGSTFQDHHPVAHEPEYWMPTPPPPANAGGSLK